MKREAVLVLDYGHGKVAGFSVLALRRQFGHSRNSGVYELPLVNRGRNRNQGLVLGRLSKNAVHPQVHQTISMRQIDLLT